MNPDPLCPPLSLFSPSSSRPRLPAPTASGGHEAFTFDSSFLLAFPRHVLEPRSRRCPVLQLLWFLGRQALLERVMTPRRLGQRELGAARPQWLPSPSRSSPCPAPPPPTAPGASLQVPREAGLVSGEGMVPRLLFVDELCREASEPACFCFITVFLQRHRNTRDVLGTSPRYRSACGLWTRIASCGREQQQQQLWCLPGLHPVKLCGFSRCRRGVGGGEAGTGQALPSSTDG